MLTRMQRKERIRDPFHPTQKPLYLLQHLIKLATNPGDIVMDCFMGLGSTGAAALELGRYFIGAEIDPAYFLRAEARLKDVLTAR
jgi:DNA modification methylase